MGNANGKPIYIISVSHFFLNHETAWENHHNFFSLLSIVTQILIKHYTINKGNIYLIIGVLYISVRDSKLSIMIMKIMQI